MSSQQATMGMEIAPGGWPGARRILALSAPAAFALIAQNLMSLLTTGVVGRLGDTALAGAGVGGALVSIPLALLFGLETGVQAFAAQRRGAGDAADAGGALTDGVWVCGLASLVLTLGALVGGPAAAHLLLHDPKAGAAGASFVVGFAPIILFVGGNMTFTAYWNGVGKPHYALVVSLIQAPIHLLLNLALTFGDYGLPRLGVLGAGLGSSLAAALALGLHIALATRLRPVPGLFSAVPTWAGVRSLLRIGLPVSLQQSLLGVGLTLYLGVVARIGAPAVAAVNVMNSLILLPVLASCGVGIAAATLVGAALGRADGKEATAWGWRTASLGALAMAPLAMILFAAPKLALGLFITEPGTIALAVAPLRILALSVCVDTFGRVLTYALRGAGSTRAPSAVSFLLQWAVQLPLSWFVGVQLGYGLVGVTLVYLARASIETAAMALIWRHGGWGRGAPNSALS